MSEEENKQSLASDEAKEIPSPQRKQTLQRARNEERRGSRDYETDQEPEGVLPQVGPSQISKQLSLDKGSSVEKNDGRGYTSSP